MPARSRLLSVQDAIDAAAEHLGQADMDSTWSSLSCGEVESLAEVFRLTGHDDTAKSIVGQHSWKDEGDDQHYPFVGSIVRRFAGEPAGLGQVVENTTDDRRGAHRVTVHWFDSHVSSPEHADELEIVPDERTDYMAAIRGWVTGSDLAKRDAS